MIVCLTKSEIEKHAGQISAEFARLLRLLRELRLGVKANTKELEFLQHCFNVLMGEARGDFGNASENVSAYKFRISKKLKKLYAGRSDRIAGLRPRPEEAAPIRFRFKLEDRRQARSLFGGSADYASVNGYFLLVIPTDPALGCVNQTRGILARVIDDAINAEFDAYRTLPEGEAALRGTLAPHFDTDGAAYKKLVGEVRRHRNNHETLCNPGNPSTRPHIREIEVKELSGRAAKVRTRECWNLHWFSAAENVYVRFWEGQNSQTYTLVIRGGRWLVQRNEYDEPRG